MDWIPKNSFAVQLCEWQCDADLVHGLLYCSQHGLDPLLGSSHATCARGLNEQVNCHSDRPSTLSKWEQRTSWCPSPEHHYPQHKHLCIPWFLVMFLVRYAVVHLGYHQLNSFSERLSQVQIGYFQHYFIPGCYRYDTIAQLLKNLFM